MINEKSLNSLLDMVPLLVCRFLADGTITFANRAFCECFHDITEKPAGKTIYDIIPEKYHKTTMMHLMSVKIGEKPLPIEYEFDPKSSSVRWQRWRIYMINAQPGEIEHLSIGKDFTEEKDFEDSLNRTQRIFKKMFDTFPEYLCLTDVEGNLIYANEAVLEHAKLPLEQLKQFNFLSFLSGPDVKTIDNAVKKLKRGEAIRKVELSATDMDGKMRDFVISVIPIETSGDKTIIMHVAIDVTEKNRLAADIKDSEKKFREIFDSSPIAINLLNSSGNTINVNDAFLRLFGVRDVPTAMVYNIFKDPNTENHTKRKLLEGKPFRYRIT